MIVNINEVDFTQSPLTKYLVENIRGFLHLRSELLRVGRVHFSFSHAHVVALVSSSSSSSFSSVSHSFSNSNGPTASIESGNDSGTRVVNLHHCLEIMMMIMMMIMVMVMMVIMVIITCAGKTSSLTMLRRIMFGPGRAEGTTSLLEKNLMMMTM